VFGEGNPDSAWLPSSTTPCAAVDRDDLPGECAREASRRAAPRRLSVLGPSPSRAAAHARWILSRIFSSAPFVIFEERTGRDRVRDPVLAPFRPERAREVTTPPFVVLYASVFSMPRIAAQAGDRRDVDDSA